MKDPRHFRLADVLVRHSCRVKPGEKVLISGTDVPQEIMEALVESVYEAGGLPSVEYSTEMIKRALMKGANPESMASIAEWEAYRMKKMDAFIGIRGYVNTRETIDLPPGKNSLYMTHLFDPVHRKIRLPETKWVVLRYPTPAMAMMAGMSTENFEDFFYSVTSEVDYERMGKAMEGAKRYLDRADRVHIEGPGTDLEFSIKGIPSVPCFGLRNIPDGEIYTAPVRDSIHGILSCNTKSTYFGYTFSDIRLEFRDGKIVEACANNSERLDSILDTDEGARYIGEFALGCNPRITVPMDDTLFDEKISGSFHFTPGSAYREADNGNISVIHWDMVYIQREDWGGGTISMDGQLIRENGIFVHEAFADLNPENLA